MTLTDLPAFAVHTVVYPTTADNYFAPNTGYNAPNSTCFGGGKAMVSHLFYYQLAVLILAWLFVPDSIELRGNTLSPSRFY